MKKRLSANKLSLFLTVFVMVSSLAIPPATAAAATKASSHIQSVTAITSVYGDGQKVSAIAVEYDKAINNTKLSASDFAVTGRKIMAVYANTTAAQVAAVQVTLGGKSAPRGTNGKYVILELSLTDQNASTIVTVGQGPSATSAKGTVKVTVKQIGNVVTTDGTIYKAPSGTFSSSSVIDTMTGGFQQFTYTDPKYLNEPLLYNLYVPTDYKSTNTYPLVLFMPDASAVSTYPEMTLIQGLGATIWAQPSEQAKHECFVVAPQYTTGTVSSSGEEDDYLDITVDLLHSLSSQYSIDTNRLYTTGQSAGCMMSIAMDIKYPDLFAASYLVAGQWDASKVAPLASQNIWIVVSAGDIQAFPGMNSITNELEGLGAKVSREIWNGQASADEFNFDVSKMTSEDCNIKYTVLQKGTVVASGLPDDPPHNHMGTWATAYSISGIRDWLFTQVKTSGYSATDLFNLGFNATHAGDYQTALAYYRLAAQQGNMSAYEMLGDAYQTGKAVAVDYAMAAYYDQKAIALGDARACTNLGIMYENGWGVPQDYTEALKLFQQATASGDFKGPRYAGAIYLDGLGGVAVDYAQAYNDFVTAANAGDVTAEYYLGLMYEKGYYVSQSYTQAISYYEKAAPSTGHAEPAAMDALGNIYENGLGVAKDLDQAISWYKQAAALGDQTAENALKRLGAA